MNTEVPWVYCFVKKCKNQNESNRREMGENSILFPLKQIPPFREVEEEADITILSTIMVSLYAAMWCPTDITILGTMYTITLPTIIWYWCDISISGTSYIITLPM